MRPEEAGTTDLAGQRTEAASAVTAAVRGSANQTPTHRKRRVQRIEPALLEEVPEAIPNVVAALSAASAKLAQALNARPRRLLAAWLAAQGGVGTNPCANSMF